MSKYVGADLRRLVAERAERLREYCLIREDDTFFGCQVDHVVSAKHGGKTELRNLAYACAFCNRHKGTDIASVSQRTGRLTPLFNPRTDSWQEHFRLEDAMIVPLTEIGEVTASILGFNSIDRILERNVLVEARRYPSRDALRRIRAGPMI
jgi:hypothetical protein